MIELQDITSLQNINLSIPTGEVVLLYGKSGCGKTTITRLLNGLVPHFYEGNLSGKVLINGCNIAEQPIHETARIVEDTSAKKFWMTGPKDLKQRGLRSLEPVIFTQDSRLYTGVNNLQFCDFLFHY